MAVTTMPRSEWGVKVCSPGAAVTLPPSPSQGCSRAGLQNTLGAQSGNSGGSRTTRHSATEWEVNLGQGL